MLVEGLGPGPPGLAPLNLALLYSEVTANVYILRLAVM